MVPARRSPVRSHIALARRDISHTLLSDLDRRPRALASRPVGLWKEKDQSAVSRRRFHGQRRLTTIKAYERIHGYQAARWAESENMITNVVLKNVGSDSLNDGGVLTI